LVFESIPFQKKLSRIPSAIIIFFIYDPKSVFLESQLFLC